MSNVDTKKVGARRQLKFDSLEEISNEVERLARAKNLKTLGNWTSGQVLMHLAIVMHGAVDGMEVKIPLPMRWMMPIVLYFRKDKFLNAPMPAGFSLPKAAAKVLIPGPTSWEDGLVAIRTGLQRLQSRPKLAKHPFLGDLTEEEWTKVQCRHCELHLSFLVDEEA
ncbi:MAG: DUF1569 domain-containing protein [Pirellula sp.]